MKDARSLLDNVRAKVSGDEKMLVVYLGPHGELRCAQANCAQRDIEQFAVSLSANSMTERMGIVT